MFLPRLGQVLGANQLCVLEVQLSQQPVRTSRTVHLLRLLRCVVVQAVAGRCQRSIQLCHLLPLLLPAAGEEGREGGRWHHNITTTTDAASTATINTSVATTRPACCEHLKVMLKTFLHPLQASRVANAVPCAALMCRQLSCSC